MSKRVCDNHWFLVIFEENLDLPASIQACPVCRMGRRDEDAKARIAELIDQIETLTIENTALDEALKESAGPPP